jgi:hypothetical protein
MSKGMSRLGRRLWEDMQVGVCATLFTPVLLLLDGQHSARALFAHAWGASLVMVPCAIVGTEFARGLHRLIQRLIRRHRSKTDPKAGHLNEPGRSPIGTLGEGI